MLIAAFSHRSVGVKDGIVLATGLVIHRLVSFFICSEVKTNSVFNFFQALGPPGWSWNDLRSCSDRTSIKDEGNETRLG